MNLSKSFRGSGFTIVELLIVIVVIGILATITIVAYNGIQDRSKTTSAQSSAALVLKKAELYRADIGYYPLTFAALTSGTAADSWYVTGVSRSLSALTDTSPTNTVSYWICGQSSTATSLSSITSVNSSNIRGIRVYYRNYGTGSNLTLTTGVVSAPAGENPIDCFNTSS